MRRYSACSSSLSRAAQLIFYRAARWQERKARNREFVDTQMGAVMNMRVGTVTNARKDFAAAAAMQVRVA
jgi:hypothetical protein